MSKPKNIKLTKEQYDLLYCMYMYACESKMVTAKSEKPHWKKLIDHITTQMKEDK